MCQRHHSTLTGLRSFDTAYHEPKVAGLETIETYLLQMNAAVSRIVIIADLRVRVWVCWIFTITLPVEAVVLALLEHAVLFPGQDIRDRQWVILSIIKVAVIDESDL